MEILHKAILDTKEYVGPLKEALKAQEELTEAVQESNKANQDGMNKAGKAAGEYDQQIKKTTTQFVTAAQRRKELIKEEVATLAKLKEESKNAWNVKQIEDYNKKIEASQNRLKTLKGSFDDNSKSLGGFGGTLKSVGAAMVAFFAVDKIIEWGKKAFEALSNFRSVQASYTTLTGSAVTANRLLAENATQAQKTPFSLRDIQETTKSLLAFNTSAAEITPTIKKLGDVSAGIGAPIKEIAELYGKARVQGRLFAEDVNQFTGRGIPLIQELAKQFGITDGEVKQLVESGKVGFDQLEVAFTSLTSEGGRFFNMMEKQSDTVGGAANNLGDKFDKLFLNIGIAGEGIFKGLLNTTSAVLEAINSLFEKSTNQKIDAQVASAKANREEAIAGQALLDRYKEITANGIEPNKEQRKELNEISVRLGEQFGKENAVLNENTGLYELNVKAVESAIKQRLTLANEEASSLILRAKAIEEEKKAIQGSINFADQQLKIMEDKTQLSTQKITKILADLRKNEINKIVSTSNPFVSESVTRIDVASENNISPEQLAVVQQAFQSLRAAQDTIRKGTAEQKALGEEYTKIIDDLKKKAGFSEEDLKNLFNPKAVEQQSQRVLGLIEELQTSIKDLTSARDKATTEKEVASYRRQIEAEQKKLDALLGKTDNSRKKAIEDLNKEIADLEKKAAAARLGLLDKNSEEYLAKVRDASLKEIFELKKRIEEKERAAGRDGTLNPKQVEQIEVLKLAVYKNYNDAWAEIVKEREQRIFDLSLDSDRKQIEAVRRKYATMLTAAKGNAAEEIAIVAARENEIERLTAQQKSNRLERQEQSVITDVQNQIRPRTVDRATQARAEEETILNIQLEYAQKQLEVYANLNEAIYAEDKKALQQRIDAIKKAQDELGRTARPFSIDTLFGLEEGTMEAIETATGAIVGSIKQVMEAELQSIDARLNATEEAIDEKEAALDRELELRAQGFASDVQGERERLAELKKQRNEQLEERRKQVRAQQALETIEQIGNLITSSTNIFKALSPIPFVGVPLAIASIAAMFGAFIAVKAQAASVSKLRYGGEIDPKKGGRLEGPMHEQGGIIVEAEGGEFVTRRESYRKHKALTEAINKDDFSEIHIHNASIQQILKESKIAPAMEGADQAASIHNTYVTVVNTGRTESLLEEVRDNTAKLTAIATNTGRIPKKHYFRGKDETIIVSDGRTDIIKD